ncbi:hypothetical protein G5V58_06935 [Nocardioides anomalus]|uniref:Uncharacterized protein n=1 Tax=Nocardioides anomalus TaxID=2712223 RepID=A0A6G6WBF6_9ACTN|nr:hypothetical protein [Nocardioides anomalus]QIG42546.1 hypothetical protein G5V58_06935 [Nocardioides anomalus]
MQRDSDEDAWRAIVENYGDRVELDDDPVDQSPAQPGADAGREERLERLFRPLPQPAEAREPVQEDPEDAFVPPPPPPLPTVAPDRMVAWGGLFGSPSVLLICLILGVHLPPWLGYLLVAAFIGGFVYLVVHMPRGEDVDPWDDGARL